MDPSGIWQERLIRGYCIGTEIPCQPIASLIGFVPVPSSMVNTIWRSFIPAVRWIVYSARTGIIGKWIQKAARESPLRA
jgi:hypothetical protein